MTKRSREDAGLGQCQAPHKRTRLTAVDRLSALSDELLLKVLAKLPIAQLVVCERLSRRYKKLAADGQIWKAHYYARFVRPRASRLPGLKELGADNGTLNFSSKGSRWLDDDHLVKSGVKTDWKRQYKLRHNWSKGSAAVSEIPVAEDAVIPPILVQMHDGIIYTADQTDGLRAWSAKGAMIARLSFPSSRMPRPPTSLAINSSPAVDQKVKVLVGFEDGSFSIYVLDIANGSFGLEYAHEPSSNGVISATALLWPYAVTMTATQLLSLYEFKRHKTHASTTRESGPPQLLHSLKSHSLWPPLSTSLRTSLDGIIVCVAYSLPTYLSGWTVGIQEVKVSKSGALLDSRLASAIDQHYRPLAFASRPMMHHLTPFVPGPNRPPAFELRHIHSKPTSLSYTHPYLLLSHADNTLTLYLVTSTAETLSIGNGSRLWGHTSSVSGAHVGGRGKAVSISRRGDELRVWELEGGFASSVAKKRLAGGELSVQIKPGTKSSAFDLPQSGLDLVNGLTESAADDESSELTLSRGWIGFDDENVVVLKEQSQGKQALVVYDFT